MSDAWTFPRQRPQPPPATPPAHGPAGTIPRMAKEGG